MKTQLFAACLVSVFSGGVYADVYEVVFSGQLTGIYDTRAPDEDILYDTIWSLDQYVPAVGDDWSYSVMLDTEVLPDMINDPGENPFANYEFAFASSFSLDGRTVTGFTSSLYFYEPNGVETAYFWGDFILGDAIIIPELRFTDPSLMSELINGGEVFTSASQFDSLDFGGMQIGNIAGWFSFSAGSSSPVQVTVTPVPVPSTMVALGLGGVLGVRRRM